MSVHMRFSFATFQNDPIRKVRSDACACSHCWFLEVFVDGMSTSEEEEEEESWEGLGGFSRQSWQSSSRLCPGCQLLGLLLFCRGTLGSPCPLRSTENASQFLLWQTPSTHRRFPCSSLSLASQLGLSPEATQLGWLDQSKVVTFVCHCYFNWLVIDVLIDSHCFHCWINL